MLKRRLRMVLDFEVEVEELTEEALRKYFTYVVAVEVDDSRDSRICEVFGVGGERAEEDILEPLLSRLSEEDARFYRGVNEEEILFENAEAVSRPLAKVS
jgi:hypothetical protein